MEKCMVDVSASKPKEQKYDWCLLRLKPNKKGRLYVFTGLTALRKVLLIHAKRMVQVTYLKLRKQQARY